jgi:hypothetical protein
VEGAEGWGGETNETPNVDAVSEGATDAKEPPLAEGTNGSASVATAPEGTDATAPSTAAGDSWAAPPDATVAAEASNPSKEDEIVISDDAFDDLVSPASVRPEGDAPKKRSSKTPPAAKA